jgi:hypothetical protein
MYGI